MAKSLLVPVDDPPAGQIVRAQLDCYPVARKDTNEILPHAPGDVSQHLVLILKLHLEHRIGQRLDNRCHYLNRIFLRQSVS